ncbi:putative phosphotransferase enzyme family protein [Phaeomoniella chlamydospora]|uniref:Putative phosphotransferase enzyme family protein n=1 Tax=Phaeomoniella chlamydospora TaxID=158046 RepID=A0A0G2ET26_PHACM|nr:putative phosphotransferase enzyme family protein [Phaeomoniella chlamydospora]
MTARTAIRQGNNIRNTSMANLGDGMTPPDALPTSYISPTSTELECDDQSQRLGRLNQNAVTTFQKCVQKDPTCDLTPLLSYHAEEYPLRRSDIENGMPTRAKKSYIKIVSKQKRKRVGRGEETPRELPDPFGRMDVIHSLAPRVEALFLSEQYPDDTDIASSQCVTRFAGHLRRAEVIWSYGEKYIVKLENQVVVKYGSNVAIEEASNLKWIGDCAPHAAIPRLLGAATIGDLTLIFMSFMEGQSLDKAWPLLTTNEKLSIQKQLNDILGKFRQIMWEEATPMGNCGNDPRCTDTRRHTRKSSNAIRNEGEFNTFLIRSFATSSPLLMAIRSQLRTDHRIVLSHGDFRPANIMVSLDSNRRVTGLLDFEAFGWYPEYWDYVKAVLSDWDGCDGWLDHLPPVIGQYHYELLVDTHIDRLSVGL